MILATILHLPASAPLWERAAAGLALVLHIGGGLSAIAAGSAALMLKKGGAAHLWAGRAFFVSMLVMAGVGIVVSPMIGQPANIFGGLLAIYLVLSGALAARRRDGGLGHAEAALATLPALLTLSLIAVGGIALSRPDGMLAGVPAPAPFVLALVAGLAAWTDLRVIRAGRLSGPRRIARHVWRMSGALLFADGSLFLGQPKVFPPALRGHPIMFLPELWVAAVMIVWLVRLARRRGRAGSMSGASPAPA